MVGPVKDGDIPVWDIFLRVKVRDLGGDPLRLFRSCLRVMTDRDEASVQGGNEVLFDPDRVFVDQGIGRRQDGRRRPVIVHHHDGPGPGIMIIEIQQIFDVGSAPGVNGLVRVADNEEVFMKAAKHGHEFILQVIDVLKFIDHDIFQPALPLLADLLIL